MGTQHSLKKYGSRAINTKTKYTPRHNPKGPKGETKLQDATQRGAQNDWRALEDILNRIENKQVKT